MFVSKDTNMQVPIISWTFGLFQNGEAQIWASRRHCFFSNITKLSLGAHRKHHFRPTNPQQQLFRISWTFLSFQDNNFQVLVVSWTLLLGARSGNPECENLQNKLFAPKSQYPNFENIVNIISVQQTSRAAQQSRPVEKSTQFGLGTFLYGTARLVCWTELMFTMISETRFGDLGARRLFWRCSQLGFWDWGPEVKPTSLSEPGMCSFGTSLLCTRFKNKLELRILERK